MLVDEVGVEPGSELRGLHDAILRQDPALELKLPELPRELDADRAPVARRSRPRDRVAARALGRGSGWTRRPRSLLTGEPGMGKTGWRPSSRMRCTGRARAVLHAAGVASSEAFATAIGRARDVERPDAARDRWRRRDRRRRGRRGGGRGRPANPRPSSSSLTADDPALPAGVRVARARPARRASPWRDRAGPTLRTRRRATCRPTSCSRRRPASPAASQERGERVGGRAKRRAAWTTLAPRAAAGRSQLRCGRGGACRAAWWSFRRPASACTAAPMRTTWWCARSRVWRPSSLPTPATSSAASS